MNSDTLPESITPATLPDSVVFEVPVYQRLFEWRRKQIVALFGDLYDSFLCNKKRYYLGILTLFNRNGVLDLIDGQQRITALILLGIAFRETVPATAYGWDRFLAGGRRLRFHARPEDSEYITARCQGSLPDDKYKNKAMEDAISLLKERITSVFVNDDVFDPETAKSFSDYILCRLTLVRSFLPDSYAADPAKLNRYFETMNSTGKQLQQHEILLVELVNGHPRSQTLTKVWKRIADTSRRYLAEWDEEKRESYRNRYRWLIDNVQSVYDEAFSEAEDVVEVSIADIAVEKNKPKSAVKSGRLSMVISFEELLLTALELTVGCHSQSGHYKTEHLLPVFRNASLKDKGLIDVFFDNLIKCRLLIDYKLVWQETDGNFDYNLLTPDTEGRLEKFQSMIHVTDDGQFYKWLVPYIKWLIANPQSTPEEELCFLKQTERGLHQNNIDKASLSYPTVNFYWFWRLDYLLWEGRDKYFPKSSEYMEAVRRYVFRSNRSREHLHPQNQAFNTEWPRTSVDSFGNLALISDSFNSQQSHDHVHVKFSRVEVQIREKTLQSLKLLLMYLEAGRDPDGWTPQAADTHERKMIEILKKVYLPDTK